VCLGLSLLFVVAPPSFFSFGSLCSGFLFLSAVSSWASGFLPAGRPRGFRVGSFPASGFGVLSCGVFLCLLLSLSLFLRFLLVVLCRPFLGLACLFLRFLFLRPLLLSLWLPWLLCLGALLLCLIAWAGSRLPLRFLCGLRGLLLLWFAVWGLRLGLLSLLWLRSSVPLCGLVLSAALVFVALGPVASGSALCLLPKLASSARLPSGGLGCGGLLSALLPASGFGVQRS
jgi:hypothetical protein